MNKLLEDFIYLTQPKCASWRSWWNPETGKELQSFLGSKHNRKIHPLAYWSRKLNEVERNYTTMEGGGVAIVDAAHWKCFIAGREFQVETDHLALQSLLSGNEEPSARMAWNYGIMVWRRLPWQGYGDPQWAAT